MMDDCSTIRARLSPPERPALATPEIIEARRHVDGCSACRAYFAQDDALVTAYLRLRRIEAPAELRARLFESLAEVRPARSAGPRSDATTPRQGRAHARMRAPVFAAAAIALMVGLWAGIESQTGNPPSDPVGEGAAFAEDYIRRAVGEDHMATSDPHAINRFLVRELGISISPLELADLEMAGAEVCLLEGRRGGIILYKQDDRVVSHYVIPRRGSGPRPPVATGQGQLAEAGEPSPAVVTWATTGVEHALVGPFPAEFLLDLVRTAVSGANAPRRPQES